MISGSGQFVAYRSVVTNTVIGDNTAPPNVFLLNRVTGSNTVLTVGQAGSSPMLWVSRPVISDDGATVAFLDLGSGLVPGDLNRVQDAFGFGVLGGQRWGRDSGLVDDSIFRAPDRGSERQFACVG